MKAWSRRFLVLYLKSLLAVAVFSAAMGTTYLAIHHDRIFPDPSTVVVYGRDSCAITQGMRDFLTQRGVPYIYASIDNGLINEEMWYYLNQVAATDTDPGYAYLPVVRIDHRTLERPDQEVVLGSYQEAKARVTE